MKEIISSDDKIKINFIVSIPVDVTALDVRVTIGELQLKIANESDYSLSTIKDSDNVRGLTQLFGKRDLQPFRFSGSIALKPREQGYVSTFLISRTTPFVKFSVTLFSGTKSKPKIKHQKTTSTVLDAYEYKVDLDTSEVFSDAITLPNYPYGMPEKDERPRGND